MWFKKPMPTTLSGKQQLFAQNVARLLQFIHSKGYAVTFGETNRTPEQAALNAAKGTGIKNSLHIDRLAIDLNLFKDGQYLTTKEAHQQFGEWWEKQHSSHRWGGRFGDPNHYSYSPDGHRA